MLNATQKTGDRKEVIFPSRFYLRLINKMIYIESINRDGKPWIIITIGSQLPFDRKIDKSEEERLESNYIALTIVSRCLCAIIPTWQLSALDLGLILHSIMDPFRFCTTTDRNSPHSLVDGWFPRARAPFVRILLNASRNSVLKML